VIWCREFLTGTINRGRQTHFIRGHLCIELHHRRNDTALNDTALLFCMHINWCGHFPSAHSFSSCTWQCIMCNWWGNSGQWLQMPAPVYRLCKKIPWYVGRCWQLAQCCDRQMELEKRLENPDSDRVRFVEGKDLAPVELQKKIDDVRLGFISKTITPILRI